MAASYFTGALWPAEAATGAHPLRRCMLLPDSPITTRMSLMLLLRRAAPDRQNDVSVAASRLTFGRIRRQWLKPARRKRRQTLGAVRGRIGAGGVGYMRPTVSLEMHVVGCRLRLRATTPVPPPISGTYT